MINLPFDVALQNVRSLIVVQNKQQKELQGNRRDKLNLKVKIKLYRT